MIKIFLSFFFCFFICIVSNAGINDSLQNEKNSIFIELGGNGYAYSLNYERFIIKKNKWKYSAKIGFSYYYAFHNATYFPISTQIYYGNKSRLELGIGYTAIFRWSKINEEGSVFNYDKSKYKDVGEKNYVKGHDEPSAGIFYLNIGWHQELKNRTFLKVEYCPWIGDGIKPFVLVPWGKISFGKNF